jgi:NADPH2:quinone reductase
MMQKRLTHTGSTLRPRPVAFKAAVAASLYEKVWPLFAVRKIAPVIDSTFPLTEAAAAHRRLESGAHFGKVVLTVA